MTDKKLPTITYDALFQNLSNPDADLDHYMQYMIEVPAYDQMVPSLLPNPALVEGIPPTPEGGIGLGLANGFMRARRHRAYKNRIAGGWQGHRIVSEGDSWFQYPTSLLDIIDHLMVDHAILSLGAAGDRLRDIQSQREILSNLQREKASALLLSAGGNDLFDNGKMGQLVEAPFPGATAADLVGPVFRTFLREVLGRYLEIFIRIHTALPRVHILTHGYSAAFPSDDRWIAQPLTDRGVAKDIQHDVVKLMLAEFNAGLVKLSKRPEFHGMIEHVDLTSIGTKRSEWHNEIHLNGPTAAKAAEKFRKVLARRLSGPVVETGIVTASAQPNASTAAQLAESFSALDSDTLLQELDLRVSLLEMDQSVAHDPLPRSLALESPMVEIGLSSIQSATRKLMRTWEQNLRDLLCGKTAETAQDNAVIRAVDKGRSALSGAIASWLMAGPFGVPAAIASALAAWLANKVIDMGLAQICAMWRPTEPVTPTVAGGAAPESAALTFGALRKQLSTVMGADAFSKDARQQRLKLIDEVVVKNIVENPRIPIDADGAAVFLKNAKAILERLGAEPDETEVPDGMQLGVEAIVATDGSRPSVYVRGGFVDLQNPLLVKSGWHTKIEKHEESIRNFIKASGRIIRMSDRSANAVYGSAWMLEGGRVATARHVIEQMVQQESSDLRLADRFYIDFSVEADRPMDPRNVFEIEGVDWAGPEDTNLTVKLSRMDVAILRLKPAVGRTFPAPIPLMDADKSIATQDWIINVGHPASPRGIWLVDHPTDDDNKISRAVLEALIGNKFGVKRLSPGLVTVAPGLAEGDEDTRHVFAHDSSTLAGSSGSGILSLTPVAMSGLHFAGQFGTVNYAHFIPPLRGKTGL